MFCINKLKILICKKYVFVLFVFIVWWYRIGCLGLLCYYKYRGCVINLGNDSFEI